MKTMLLGSCVFAILVAAAGCSSQDAATDEVSGVSVDTDTVGAQASSTSADGWTIDAQQPTELASGMIATFVATAPAGGTTKGMGVCLLRRNTTFVACNVSADCLGTVTLPTGGQHYCALADGATQKYCYYRPGARTSYCKSGLLAAGTYSSPAQPVGNGSYVSNACFGSACAPDEPSVSSILKIRDTGDFWPGGKK